mmetsp:Transcript_15086/g.21059  ORF Transcript_15086/g.21059 Transcript_15086/m.21059 type:complete len:203 (-) Transcript_15086:59-667(-)
MEIVRTKTKKKVWYGEIECTDSKYCQFVDDDGDKSCTKFIVCGSKYCFNHKRMMDEREKKMRIPKEAEVEPLINENTANEKIMVPKESKDNSKHSKRRRKLKVSSESQSEPKKKAKTKENFLSSSSEQKSGSDRDETQPPRTLGEDKVVRELAEEFMKHNLPDTNNPNFQTLVLGTSTVDDHSEQHKAEKQNSSATNPIALA